MNNLIIKTTLNILFFMMFAVNTSNTFAESTADLLPHGDKDLKATKLQPTKTMQLINQSRDDISISWALQPTIILSEIPKPYKASSKDYWLAIDGKQLKQGVKVQTAAPGAMIKISPRPNSSNTTNALPVLDINQLMVIDAQGKQQPQSAMAKSATAAQLKSAQLSFPPGTVIIQLDKKLGHGEFTIKHQGIKNEQQAFILYVRDINSDYNLSVQTENDTVFTDHQLAAQITVKQNKVVQTISDIEVYLSSPDGEKFTVDNKTVKNGIIDVSRIIDSKDDKKIGLWELHVMTKSAAGGMEIQRNVKTTFAYVQPNAALTKTVKITRNKNDDTLTLRFGIDAVSSGRFELRGTLYGTDTNDKLTPVMFANSAGWREAGASTLNLTFELNKVNKSRLKEPYELRDLRLLDQSRMMLLHKQQEALRFY